MSNTNVALVQSLYQAFGRGDFAAILDCSAPDVSWCTVGRRSDFPAFGQRSGHPGMSEFFAHVAAEIDFKEFVPTEFYADGDTVIVLGHYTGTMKRSGKPFSSEWVHIYTLRDGKVAKFREFTDTAQAVEAYRG